MTVRLPPPAIMLISLLLAFVITLTEFILALSAPQLDLPKGAHPVQVGAIELTETDLYPEPDHVGTYRKMEAFFARQTQIANQLGKSDIKVRYQTLKSAIET